jgi:cystathionine beta-lyase
MQYDFDAYTTRRQSDSIKWRRYGSGVIPLWIADMDFPCARPIIKALHNRVEEAVFGYGEPDVRLRPVLVERLKRLYGWEIREEDIVFLPGVVTGLNLAFRLFSQPGDGVIIQPPVYSHFMDALAHGRALADPPLVEGSDGRYEIDFAAFEAAITGGTRVFLMCNPHNPVGRVYGRRELETLAEICLRRDLLICSDEIHCDLVYPGLSHIPIAALGRDVARRTVTLMAPSKTFNLAGLGCAFAVIENRELRDVWTKGSRGIVPFVNVMGFVSALAGYTDGQEWLDQALAYLAGNRDFLASYVKERLPGVKMTPMEATYLAWLDCRDAGITGSPFRYFLKEAQVALNDGVEYGRGGEGFVRLNFGCARGTLTGALGRMERALARLQGA